MWIFQLMETILHYNQMEYSKHCKLLLAQFKTVKFLSKHSME